MKVIDIANTIAPNVKHKIIGILPGEKLHEQMISAEDSYSTYEYPNHYKILPQIKLMLQIILANSQDYLQCNSQTIPGKRNCFQNIAIDIMPDENWKLYLLEINGKPGMNAPSYHWGGLGNFTNSMMDKLTNVNSTNKKGFILINGQYSKIS
jgi:hypothetical protein